MNTFSKHSRDRDAKFYVSTSPARTGRSAWPGLCLPVAIALLFLLLMPMRLRAQSTQEYEQQKRERMDLLKKLGLITSDDQKPSDYRTENEGNPMSSKFTNLATVPEMYVYSSTYYNSSLKRTERFFYDNVNKKAELLDEVSPLQHLDNSAARIIKAVPLNVNKNAGANQEYTAELEAISATQFKVSIRNKDGAVNTSSYTHTFTVNDWSVMHNREKEQLFDYYFQIVSGDFNGDGCDDIAYYMPSMIKGTDMGGIGVHWIVQVVFLQRESNAIKQLGSVLSLGMTDNGLKNYWEFTPGIHLSVTNLNKDSSDDLVITRGWTKPANGLNNGKDGASTIYIYDNLKNRSTTPSFTRKLEETGNTFTDFNADIIEQGFPYIWKCDITQEHTTGLMAVTTATGNVLSPDNRALVIAGYSIIKQTDGYYSDRYIGFHHSSGATHAQ
ncbi:MAG: hypothetical protein LBS43_04745, partial [Prevotellaceae bacterium]|nr:hypothetical protein [Prevotellaceae bacterium]